MIKNKDRSVKMAIKLVVDCPRCNSILIRLSDGSYCCDVCQIELPSDYEPDPKQCSYVYYESNEEKKREKERSLAKTKEFHISVFNSYSDKNPYYKILYEMLKIETKSASTDEEAMNLFKCGELVLIMQIVDILENHEFTVFEEDENCKVFGYSVGTKNHKFIVEDYESFIISIEADENNEIKIPGKLDLCLIRNENSYTTFTVSFTSEGHISFCVVDEDKVVPDPFHYNKKYTKLINKVYRYVKNKM